MKQTSSSKARVHSNRCSRPISQNPEPTLVTKHMGQHWRPLCCDCVCQKPSLMALFTEEDSIFSLFFLYTLLFCFCVFFFDMCHRGNPGMFCLIRC